MCRCVWPSTDYAARSFIGNVQLVTILLLCLFDGKERTH